MLHCGHAGRDSPAAPSHTRMNDDHFLTTEEVLDYLQVNLRTVYRLIKAGKIPAVRVGRQWRFRKRDIDAWLRRQRPAPNAAGGPASAPRPRRRRRAAGARPAREDARRMRRLRRRHRPTTGRRRSSGCRPTDYDLLITDLKMPGMDGLSVIREARRQVVGPADHHHHRLLDRGERDRGDQPRRVRLPDQAVPAAAHPRGRRARARRAVRRSRGFESQVASAASKTRADCCETADLSP